MLHNNHHRFCILKETHICSIYGFPFHVTVIATVQTATWEDQPWSSRPWQIKRLRKEDGEEQQYNPHNLPDTNLWAKLPESLHRSEETQGFLERAETWQAITVSHDAAAHTSMLGVQALLATNGCCCCVIASTATPCSSLLYFQQNPTTPFHSTQHNRTLFQSKTPTKPMFRHDSHGTQFSNSRVERPTVLCTKPFQPRTHNPRSESH